MARMIDADKLITAIQGTASQVAMDAPYDPEWFTRLAARQFEILKIIDDAPTVDAYTEEQVDSIIQKADLLEIENRNLEQEVDWLKNCLNCETRNKCPRHCGKVVHGCDHWIDGDPLVHGRWLFDSNTERYFCSACNEQALYTSRDVPEYDYDWEENLRYSHTETYIEEHLTNYCPNCGAKMDGDGNA